MQKQIILSKNVRVSDPCYTDDVWCKTRLKNVLPGAYNWSVNHTDLGDWGNRVSSITLIHENYNANDSLVWDYHSEIGVDSGQAGIFCESSYRNDKVFKKRKVKLNVIPVKKFTYKKVKKLRDRSNYKFSLNKEFKIKYRQKGDVWYEKMCRFTLSGESFGAYDTGVVSSSGIGDGSYPLYVVYDNNDKIIAMQIDYLPEDEEDEDDDTDCCGVCGIELESDGSCNYCDTEDAEEKNEESLTQN
jgi:hypothetical protein